MWDLIKIVIPKVKAEWKDLAYSMGFKIADIKALETDSNLRNLESQCEKLFENWLSGARGCTPKTLGKLLERIEAVESLFSAAEDIKKELGYQSKQFSTVPNGEFTILECNT